VYYFIYRHARILSLNHPVILIFCFEVSGLDRTGLLFDLARI
jgi:hypothetical protein